MEPFVSCLFVDSCCWLFFLKEKQRNMNQLLFARRFPRVSVTLSGQPLLRCKLLEQHLTEARIENSRSGGSTGSPATKLPMFVFKKTFLERLRLQKEGSFLKT